MVAVAAWLPGAALVRVRGSATHHSRLWVARGSGSVAAHRSGPLKASGGLVTVGTGVVGLVVG
jgi:hypothetical protein